MKGIRIAGVVLASIVGIPPVLTTIIVGTGVAAVFLLIIGVVALAMGVALFLYLGVLPWIKGGLPSVVAGAFLLVGGVLLQPESVGENIAFRTPLVGFAIAVGVLLVVGVLISLTLGGLAGIRVILAWFVRILGRLVRAVLGPTGKVIGWLVRYRPTILVVAFWVTVITLIAWTHL